MNDSVLNRYFTPEEAQIIRDEYWEGRVSVVSFCRQLHVTRRTIWAIIHKTGAYTSQNDTLYTMLITQGVRLPPHVQRIRKTLVPLFIWKSK